MAKMLRTISIYLKREISSVRFWGCAIICSLLMFFFVYMDYQADFPDMGLYYFLQGVEYSGAGYLFLIITALPVSTIFCEDWESGMIKFLLPRCERRNYALSLTFTAGIASGACMFIAYIVFSAFILIKYPLVPNIDVNELQYNVYGFPNSKLLVDGHEILCYLLYFITQSAMAALFSALAILQSVILTNKKFTLISPVVVEMILSVITGLLKPPVFLDTLSLYSNNLALYVSFGGDLENMTFSPMAALYPLIHCCLSLTLITICVSRLIKDKVGNKI